RDEATSPRVATRGLSSPPFTDQFRNEPHSDFSRDDVQEAMRAALAAVKGQLGKTYPLVIGGREVTTAETIDSLNPSHRREVVGRCGKATVRDAQEAVAAAWGAFPKWRDTDAAERADSLFRAAAVMR